MSESGHGDVVGQIATGLARLQRQFVAQAEAARDIVSLVADAESLAEMVRALTLMPRSGADGGASMKQLEDKLTAFLGEVVRTMRSAVNVATINGEAAAKLSEHCQALNDIAQRRSDGVDKAALRTELTRMAATISSITVAQSATGQLGEELAAMASIATDLGKHTAELCNQSKSSAQLGVALSRGLRKFASDAESAASSLAQHAALAKSAVLSTASYTKALAGATSAPDPAPASTGWIVTTLREGSRLAQTTTATPAEPLLQSTPGAFLQW